jgi:hypothetical protein
MLVHQSKAIITPTQEFWTIIEATAALRSNAPQHPADYATFNWACAPIASLAQIPNAVECRSQASPPYISDL